MDVESLADCGSDFNICKPPVNVSLRWTEEGGLLQTGGRGPGHVEEAAAWRSEAQRCLPLCAVAGEDGRKLLCMVSLRSMSFVPTVSVCPTCRADEWE